MKILAVIDHKLKDMLEQSLNCDVDFVMSWHQVRADSLASYNHVIASGSCIEKADNPIHLWGIASEIRYFNIPAIFIHLSPEAESLMHRMYPQIRLISYHESSYATQLLDQLMMLLPEAFHLPHSRSGLSALEARNDNSQLSGKRQNTICLTGISGARHRQHEMEQNDSSLPNRSLSLSSIPLDVPRTSQPTASYMQSVPVHETFRNSGMGEGRQKDDSFDILFLELDSIPELEESDEFEAIDKALSSLNTKMEASKDVQGKLEIMRTLQDFKQGAIEFGTLLRAVHTLSCLQQTGILEMQNEFRTTKLEFRQGKTYASCSEVHIANALTWTNGEYLFNTSHMLSSYSTPLDLDKLMKTIIMEQLPIHPLLHFLESEFSSYLILTNRFNLKHRISTSYKWWEKCHQPAHLSEIMMHGNGNMELLARDIYFAWVCDEVIFTQSPDLLSAVIIYDTAKPRTSNYDSGLDLLAQSALSSDTAANSQLNAIRNDLLRVRASFDKDDGYAILGLSKGCGLKALNDAYYAWINRYHTDRFVRYKDPFFVQIANELMMLMNSLYPRLTKAEKRIGKPLSSATNLSVRRKPVELNDVQGSAGAVSERMQTSQSSLNAVNSELLHMSDELRSMQSLYQEQTSSRPEQPFERRQRAAIRPASVANLTAITSDKRLSTPISNPHLKMSDMIVRSKNFHEQANASSSSTPVRTWTSPNVTPDQHFQTAKKKLKLGLASEAYLALTLALKGDPEHPDYNIYHAYASFLLDPSKREESIERIQAMVETIKSELDQTLTAENKMQLFAPYYFIGKMEIAAERYHEGYEALQLARKLNPSDLDTQRTLKYVFAQIDQRGDRQDKSKSTLVSKFIERFNI